MGKSRFLPPDLNAALLVAVALALLFPGCGDDAGLLVSIDTEEMYSGAGGGGGYGVTSKNPADFGTIAGKISYQGRRRSGRIDLAKAYCINNNPNGMLSENFMVGPNGELGGVIVYVKRGLTRMEFEVPPEPIILDQKACRYIPHLSVLRVGQDLIIRSSDRHAHNVHWMPGVNGQFNQPMNVPFDLDPKTFFRTQVAASVKCDIHGWMQSYMAVLPHPCWTITKDDGTFEIKGVPPGTLQLAAWHEELGELTIDLSLAKNESKAHDFQFPAKS